MMNEAARKDDVRDVARDLVVRPRPEHPLLGAPQDVCGFLEVQQRQTRAIQAPSDGLAHAVVDDEPAVLGLERRGPHAHAFRVPPAALPAAEHQFGRSPALEVGRAGQPHIGAVHGGRPVEEHPVATNPARQQDSVLVFGRHDHPQTLERLEVLGLGE